MIVFGERLLAGPGGDVAARALLNLASRLGLAGPRGRRPARDPRQHQRPRPARGRLRGAATGRATRRWPSRPAARPRSPRASPTATSTRSTSCTPTRCARIPTARCGSRRWAPPQNVIAHESVMTETVRELRRRRLPGRGVRREGGHARAPRRPPPAPARRDRPRQGRDPGRRGPRRLAGHLRRRRARRDTTSASWPGRSPRASCSRRCRSTTGLTLDVIGGRGVRWPAHEAAAKLRARRWEPVKLKVPRGARAARATKGALRLGTYRSLWSSKEVDVSPALQFLRPQQVVELSPRDAERLGIGEGDHVEVARPTARACAARCACAPRSRAARCSSPRARRTSPPTR